MKLEKKIIISGKIIAQSGIMIGGNNTAFEIGGTDKQVVRNPINKMPYVPGSSLKGKMRSLFELSQGTINSEGGPTQNPNNAAAQLFGHIKNKEENDNKSQQPSRLIVRDGEMTNAEVFADTDLLYTEVKAENSIDRVTAEANPRFFERVPKGAEFELNLTINVFDKDVNGAKFLDYTYEALRLVQDDYLGGSGSRGNGQISFHIKSVKERYADYYKGSKEAEVELTIPEDLS
jgi:CRISPR-associated protein Csm3